MIMKSTLARLWAPALVAIAAVLVGVASPVAAQTPEQKEFRIGGVLPLSGPFGPLGESMRRGAELAAEMRGGKVLGVPVKFTWEDDEAKPQVTAQKTTRLLAQGTDMMLASATSGSTLAMMKLNEKRKVPLIVTMSVSDDITGKQKNPYTFRTSSTIDMEVRMLTAYVVETGKKKVYALNSDFSGARELWASLRPMLEAKGISVVGEEFIPLGTKDYSIVINKLAKSDADLIFFSVAGNDGITFLKQAEQVKLKESKKLFGTVIMDEMVGAATGSAGVGVYTTLRYDPGIDTPANRTFVAAYQKKYGELPGQPAGLAYDGMAWFLDVVDSTKSWDSEKWVKAFSGSTRKNSNAGVKVMRPCDNQAEQPGFFGRSITGPSSARPVAMQITATYEKSKLFDSCK